MEKENIKIEEGPIFPEESSSIIEGLLEKYGLIKSKGEIVKKIADLFKDSTKKPDEKKKILESLPEAKLAKLVADYGYKKVSIEKIPLRIEKDLNISREKAKKMAEELKATLLDLIKTVKPADLTKEKKAPVAEAFKPEPKTKPSINLPKEEKDSFKKDTYREPVE